jgi:single-strand DNA-binding protein
MNNLNSVLIEGFLQAAPELKTTEKGSPFAFFSMVSNRYYKNDDGTLAEQQTKINVVAFGKLADSIMELGTKDRGIRVVGRLGYLPDRKSLGIIAEHCEFRPMLSNTKEE